jgi:hypothetical protein
MELFVKAKRGVFGRADSPSRVAAVAFRHELYLKFVVFPSHFSRKG